MLCRELWIIPLISAKRDDTPSFKTPPAPESRKTSVRKKACGLKSGRKKRCKIYFWQRAQKLRCLPPTNAKATRLSQTPKDKPQRKGLMPNAILVRNNPYSSVAKSSIAPFGNSPKKSQIKLLAFCFIRRTRKTLYCKSREVVIQTASRLCEMQEAFLSSSVSHL